MPRQLKYKLELNISAASRADVIKALREVVADMNMKHPPGVIVAGEDGFSFDYLLKKTK